MRSLQAGDPAWVGSYRVLARLGAGGMGVVYLARSPGARLVALKLIRREFADADAFRGRFRREIAAARRVSGLYTTPVLDADPDAPDPWFAAAYVPAPTLGELLADAGPLPESAVRALGAGLVEALQAIHGAGLVHRDLKPGNILLAEDGPKIIDFGIAKAADATRITSTGAMVGTLAYMAPEQIAGRQDAGPAADVFSLGAVLVHAATGVRPFGRRDPATVLYEVMYEEPSLDGVPASLRGLLTACLAKDPAERPAPESVLDALTPVDPRALDSPALRREVAAREAEATRAASAPTEPPPLPRVDETGAVGRRRVLGLAAAVAVAGIGAGAAGWTLTREDSEPAEPAEPAPRGTALGAAPPPAWTFTPPENFKGRRVLLAGDVVLWGGGDGMYGVDARTGRRLWTREKFNSTYAHGLARGSEFVVLGGLVGDPDDQLITLVDARTGRATNRPEPRDVAFSPSSAWVVGDTLIVRSLEDFFGLDLTGEIRWQVSPRRGAVREGADGTGFFLGSEASLTAYDPATGEKRWVRPWPGAGGPGKGWDSDFVVGGGRVFGSVEGTLHAVDAASGTPVWSRPADDGGRAVVLGGPDAVFAGDALYAYDQASGTPRWTLPLPHPFSGESGAMAASGAVVAAAFNEERGTSRGFLVATTGGRALWAHSGPTETDRGWFVTVSGSSVFATDQQRLYRFEVTR